MQGKNWIELLKTWTDGQLITTAHNMNSLPDIIKFEFIGLDDVKNLMYSELRERELSNKILGKRKTGDKNE